MKGGINLPHLFRQSVYSPEFYRSLSHRPFSFSLKYFFALVTAFALALALLSVITTFPLVYRLARDFGPGLTRLFPNDMRIEIRNGEVSANVPQPFLIPIPPELETEGHPENMLVIDTEHPFSTGRFDELNTLSLLTKTEFAWRDDDNRVRIQKIEIREGVLDKPTLESWTQALRTALRWSAPVLAAGAVILMFLLISAVLSFQLFYLLLGAVFVMLLGRMRGMRLSYKKSYQIGIHAISLGVVFSSLMWIGAPQNPLVFTGLLVLTAWFNLIPQTPTAEAPAPEE